MVKFIVWEITLEKILVYGVSYSKSSNHSDYNQFWVKFICCYSVFKLYIYKLFAWQGWSTDKLYVIYYIFLE